MSLLPYTKCTTLLYSTVLPGGGGSVTALGRRCNSHVYERMHQPASSVKPERADILNKYPPLYNTHPPTALILGRL